jgi:hypothetical protein
MLFGFRQVSNTSWDYHHSFVFACFLVFNDFWINHTHTHTHTHIYILMRTSWSHGHATHTQRHQFPESQVNQVW